MISVLIEVVGFLSNLGIDCKALGVERNAFGTGMISSVGSPDMKVEDGFAPLCGFTHTAGVVTICSIKERNKLQLDGSYKKEDTITVNVSLDHRYGDGMISAKLAKEVRIITNNKQ